MELIILTLILKWLTFASFVIAFAIWNASNTFNGFLKWMFLVGALCIMPGDGYHEYLIIPNMITFGLLGIIWTTHDTQNMFIKGYLLILTFLHFYILMK